MLKKNKIHVYMKVTMYTEIINNITAASKTYQQQFMREKLYLFTAQN